MRLPWTIASNAADTCEDYRERGILLLISTALAGQARMISASKVPPREVHAEAERSRMIVRHWALNFIRDTEQSPQMYGL